MQLNIEHKLSQRKLEIITSFHRTGRQSISMAGLHGNTDELALGSTSTNPTYNAEEKPSVFLFFLFIVV